ncbi:MAG: leucyl aminopeptidase, partial [Patescibacteria group bacterium]
LAYTEDKWKPHAMVDIATLTGAVSVALGYNITGIMGNDHKLLNELKDAAKVSGERVWELPLDDDFVELCKGSFTDLQNATDGVRAGSIMGGAFLKHFVKTTPWVHIDIGGTAWAEKPSATTKYGATAVMLRTFFEMAKRHGS